MACVSSNLSFGSHVSTAVVGAHRSEISGLTTAFQKLTASTLTTRVAPNFIVCPEASKIQLAQFNHILIKSLLKVTFTHIASGNDRVTSEVGSAAQILAVT